jgi:hypothetical protein
MMVLPSHNSFHHCCQILLALLLFSLHILTHHIEAYGSKVEVLPGFHGPLPFELETGLAVLTIFMKIFYFNFTLSILGSHIHKWQEMYKIDKYKGVC